MCVCLGACVRVSLSLDREAEQLHVGPRGDQQKGRGEGATCLNEGKDSCSSNLTRIRSCLVPPPPRPSSF